MSLLVAVKSCQRDRDLGYHDVIRDTWGKDLQNANLVFFSGGTSFGKDDEVLLLNCDDTYIGLPNKTRRIVELALVGGDDFIFLCDTGSFVIPHHLMGCGFEQSDYMGFWGGGPYKPFPYAMEDNERGCPRQLIPKCYPWAAGGGYFLSRKAMEIVAKTEPKYWAEDLGVGQMMAENGIRFDDRPRRFKGYVVDWVGGDHNCGSGCRRKWMTERYEETKKLCETEGCMSAIWDKYEDRGRLELPTKPKFVNPTPWDKSSAAWRQK